MQLYQERPGDALEFSAPVNIERGQRIIIGELKKEFRGGSEALPLSVIFVLIGPEHTTERRDRLEVVSKRILLLHLVDKLHHKQCARTHLQPLLFFINRILP